MLYRTSAVEYLFGVNAGRRSKRDMKMARTARQTRSAGNEEIDVSAFKDIQIRFPGDVYILAVWLAMSDRSKSTPTCKPHTTLHGLARHMESLHGTDYSNPLSSDDVMAAFRGHGIAGNPLLKLSESDCSGVALSAEVPPSNEG